VIYASTLTASITAPDVLIPSLVAVLSAAIVGLEILRRARLRGDAKVLIYPLWTWCLVLGCVFLAGILVWTKFWGSEIQRQESPVTVAVFSAVSLAAAVLLALYFNGTVWVDAAGIHARPAFQKPRFISWDSISEVSTKGGNITIVGPAGVRISVSGMMIGVRDLREELASRRPDMSQPVRPQATASKQSTRSG
jgi:hypothetical protein